MAQDWDIKPRGIACEGCDKEFEDGQGYYSSLSFCDDGYVRNDYCTGCWDQQESRGISVWQGVFRLPPAEPDEVLKKETAESLLRRLMEDEDESKGNIIFILAVMLERNKILEERHVQYPEDGSVIRIYEHKRGGETFLIPDPQLRLGELEEVQREVVELLGGGAKKEEEPDDQNAATEAAESSAGKNGEM